jgi:hypothetical protein
LIISRNDYLAWESHLVHIPKFRIGAGKVLANASTPDFSGTSDIILGYALLRAQLLKCKSSVIKM